MLRKLSFSLDSEKFEKLRKELAYLLMALAAGIIIFKIVFYNESFLNVLKMVLSLLWLFVLPGYFIMFYWQEKLDFVERFIIGTALAFGLMGILSYYTGLAGITIKLHVFILPLALILIGLFFGLRSK